MMKKFASKRTSMRLGSAIASIAIGLVLFIGSSAQAATVTISTSLNPLQAGTDNQGWWSNTTTNSNPTNDNYIVGNSNDNFRAFFSFDLSGISGVVTSARFDVRRYTQSGAVNLSLWDVSTSAAELITTRNNISNPAIFADLGSGTSYGFFSVANGASTDVLSFTLNAAALNDINADIGLDYFSIGAALLNGGTIFSSSSSEPGNTGGAFNFIQNLVLEVQPNGVVPEPATLALIGLGLAGLSLSRRKKA